MVVFFTYILRHILEYAGGRILVVWVVWDLPPVQSRPGGVSLEPVRGCWRPHRAARHTTDETTGSRWTSAAAHRRWWRFPPQTNAEARLRHVAHSLWRVFFAPVCRHWLVKNPFLMRLDGSHAPPQVRPVPALHTLKHSQKQSYKNKIECSSSANKTMIHIHCKHANCIFPYINFLKISLYLFQLCCCGKKQ